MYFWDVPLNVDVDLAETVDSDVAGFPRTDQGHSVLRLFNADR